MATIRRAAVAGSFYEGHPLSLKTQIEDCFLHRLGPGKLPRVNKYGARNIRGIVSPHAGYIYSGAIASWGYFDVAQDGCPKDIIIIGPNHRGIGVEVSLVADGLWQTPLGFAKINIPLAREILSATDIIKNDKSSMHLEHSIEVQIPFLQFLFGEEFSFVPICLSDQSLSTIKQVAEILSIILRDKDFLIIASSDFSHYEPQKVAERKDKIALDCILKFEVEEFYREVEKEDISLCGIGAISVMLLTLKELNTPFAHLLKYATSGDITKTYSQVVGYASLKFSR